MPPEIQGIQHYEWNEVLIPFRTENTALARESGAERVALELHGGHCIYNVQAVLRCSRTLDHPEPEFPGFVTAASRVRRRVW